ncbi:uncharacterized protein C14orf93 [Misgurnus anguillicaudatus]|uniref:uncharacterized protein C14orf93 n=1 Tax=Misgurnus anguillicaudatus TaxID=75329 RepID=UPI003CCF5438
MACKRNCTLYTPLGEVDQQPTGIPVSSTNDLIKHLIASQNALAGQFTSKLDAICAFQQETLQRLEALERKVALIQRTEEESTSTNSQKRRKRAHNVSIAEAVRRLHNSENNPYKYDPQTGVNSPHNQAVTTRLLQDLCRGHFANADPEIIKASCKTYYETQRRKFSLAQPDKSELRNSIKAMAKSKQKKRRLLESRSKVLQTDLERKLWETATADMMSDEEDGVVEGRPVWVVKPPGERNPELSALCQELQKRLEADLRYADTHHLRVMSVKKEERSFTEL